jgi:hypothetical protein
MKTYLIILVLLGFTALNAQKSWQHYHDRIPAWPAELTLNKLDEYTNALLSLREEIGQHLGNTGEQLEAGFEGMTTEQAMEMAANYQEHMLGKDPEEMMEMAEQINAYQTDLNEAIVLDQKLEAAIKKFRNEYEAAVEAIWQQYPCEMGMEDANDRCDERSKALKELGIRLEALHFTGEQAGIRLAAEGIREHIYKKSLPSALKQEQEQFKALGIEPPAGSTAGIELVKSDVDLLLRCADFMGWVAGIRSDDNLFFYPGQRY